MKNTLKNKGKFFAQYYLQEIVISDYTSETKGINRNPFEVLRHFPQSYLELKPL